MHCRHAMLVFTLCSLGLVATVALGCGEPVFEDGVARAADVAVPPDVQVAVVAARYAYTRLVSGHHHLADAKVVLDPTFPVRRGSVPGDSGATAVRHRPVLIDAVALALDADVGRRADFVTCPDGAMSCSIAGGAVLVGLLEPRVRDTTAAVNVSLNYELPGRSRSLHTTALEVQLQREGDGWVVVDAGSRFTH